MDVRYVGDVVLVRVGGGEDRGDGAGFSEIRFSLFSFYFATRLPAQAKTIERKSSRKRESRCLQTKWNCSGKTVIFLHFIAFHILY